MERKSTHLQRLVYTRQGYGMVQRDDVEFIAGGARARVGGS